MSKSNTMQEKLLRYDLENIFKLAEKYNTQTILLSYPSANSRDNVRVGVTARHNAIFVDIYSAFKKLKESPGYHEGTFFNVDGHCNANGYKIMAEEIYKVLRNIK